MSLSGNRQNGFDMKFGDYKERTELPKDQSKE